MKWNLNKKSKNLIAIFLFLILFSNSNIKKTEAVIYINPGKISSFLETNECTTSIECEIRVNSVIQEYTLHKNVGDNRKLTSNEIILAEKGIQEYLLKLKEDLTEEYNSITIDKKNTIENSVAISDQTAEDKKAIALIKTIIDNASSILDEKLLPVYDKMSSDTEIFYQNAIIYLIDMVKRDQISNVVRIWRRVYLYKELDRFLTGSTTIDITKVNPKILLVAKTQKMLAYDGGFCIICEDENELKSGEINPRNAYAAAVINGITFSIGQAASSTNPQTTISDPKDMDINKAEPIPCKKDIGLWGIVTNTSNSKCSIVAFLINNILLGINALTVIFVNLAGSLFDWIYNEGIINFKDLVNSSGAYIIYKTVILSLLVSVMTFIVFYLIIRRLIDDDGENMNKLLPKIIITALFVYFSFTVTGWIIDQSNIITIYLYRSLTHSEIAVQPISTVFKNILSLNNGGANSNYVNDNYGISLGSWDAIPYTAGQVLVSVVGVFVLFEGAILILTRAIVLLLCMIFSPIMLIPEGLTEFTDKYRKVIIDNFTGNVMLGPIFMFLVVLAVKIGTKATEMVTNGPVLDSSAPANTTGFMAGILSSVIVITVLQLAISVSKSLSGSLGEKIGGQISKYTGGAAFGGGAKILRNTVGAGALAAKNNGWMMGKKGSTQHRLMTGLYNGASKATFDTRNIKGFQNAANFSGSNASSFGQGTQKSAEKRYQKKLFNASKYHNSLDSGGKERNIKRLNGALNNLLPSQTGKQIAKSIGEENWKPSIKERLNNDSAYNEEFDKAHNETDETKREKSITAVIDKHFKENGEGSEHFSKEINKPENNKIKNEFKNAISEKDPVKRKITLTKIISDLDKKSNKEDSEESSTASLTESLQKIEQKSEPKSNVKNQENINSLRDRLQAKYSKQDVSNYKAKRETLYQDKSLSEVKLRQEAENEIKKAENSGFIPSAQDLNTQNSLKTRLQEKYGGVEKMVNGKIEKEFSQEQLDRKIQEHKDMKENQYQDKVLNEALPKKDNNDPTDDKPFNSPLGEGDNDKSSVSVDQTGKLKQMYTSEELSVLNKNRNNREEADNKAA